MVDGSVSAAMIAGSTEEKGKEVLMVKRTERGWAGHFICANSCRFRRNTLLEQGTIKIVVSTVGLMENVLKNRGVGFDEDFSEIGAGRYYETMAFFSNPNDTRYHDIDVERGVDFESPWSISDVDADDKANDMHEAVVAELTTKLENGELVEQS